MSALLLALCLGTADAPPLPMPPPLPPVREADRFLFGYSTPDEVWAEMSWTEQHLQCLRERLSLEPHNEEYLCEWIDEVSARLAALTRLRLAMIPPRPQDLERLRQLLGPERYYRGELPPLPTWRFARR